MTTVTNQPKRRNRFSSRRDRVLKKMAAMRAAKERKRLAASPPEREPKMRVVRCPYGALFRQICYPELSMTQPEVFQASHQPLVVCCGVGVDSVAMLVGMRERRIVPGMICFADVGSERESTYEYIPILNDWLKSAGFPELTIVTYQAKNFKHYPPYFSLEENILTNVSLPSIAYGGHTCSAKWKIDPINRRCDEWVAAKDCWAHGGKVLKAIGFEDSPHELRRSAKGCATFATQADESSKYELWFPLQQWHWSRERCKTEIVMAGLPLPDKSSCYFCTAMKTHEVDGLTPDKLRRIVIIEARTTKRHLEFAEAKGWPRGQGVPMTEGLWRKRVKGKFANGKPNGAIAKPGSMTEYIREKGLLPGAEIDRIISATPTNVMTQDDFVMMGHNNWQDWIKSIILNGEHYDARRKQ